MTTKFCFLKSFIKIKYQLKRQWVFRHRDHNNKLGNYSRIWKDEKLPPNPVYTTESRVSMLFEREIPSEYRKNLHSGK